MEEKPSHKPPAPPPEMQAVPWEDPLAARLQERFPSLVAKAYLGQPFVDVPAAQLLELLEHLRDAEAFDFLIDLTAVDYPVRPRRFELIYLVHSFEHNSRLRIKTHLAADEPAASIAGLHPGANWLEREVFDMFGIVFQGHPDLKRILLPDGWEGHPLRKETSILAMDNAWVKANLGIESGH